MTAAERCADCGCCAAHLCAVARINRKACVDYALVATTDAEEWVAACPCAPRGATYPPVSNSAVVIPFPTNRSH